MADMKKISRQTKRWKGTLMTPTQAQIEAAAKAAFNAACDGDDEYTWEDYIPVAKAALTAAAQAGEQVNKGAQSERIDSFKQELVDKITAAILERDETVRDETIERCAQVVEEYDEDDPAVEGRGVLAAAIRALKDAP